MSDLDDRIRVLLAATPQLRAVAEARVAAADVDVTLLAAVPLGDPPPDVIVVQADGWHATLAHLRASFPSATRVVLADSDGPTLAAVQRDGVHDVLHPDEPPRALARALRLGAARARMERRFESIRRRYRDAVHSGGVGGLTWDLRTKEIRFDPGWKAMLGYAFDEVGDDAQAWFRRVHRDDHAGLRDTLKALLGGETRAADLTYRLQNRDRQWLWVALQLAVDKVGDGHFVLRGEQRDVTVERVTEQRLAWADQHDALTGLLGRGAFVDTLQARLAGEPSGVLAVCGVDDLRAINQTHGREAGDEVLLWLTGLIEDLVGEDGVAGRLTGHKLGFVLPGDELEAAAALVQEMRTAVAEEVFITADGTEFSMSAAFALVQRPTELPHARAWLGIADSLLQQAETEGGAVLALSREDAAKPFRITLSGALVPDEGAEAAP